MTANKLKNRDNGPRLTAGTQLIPLAALAALLIPLGSAQATDRHWTGNTDTEWNRNANWNSRPPDLNDNAVFDRLFSNQPMLTTGQTIGGIWMSGVVVPDVTISSTGGVLSLRGVADQWNHRAWSLGR